ncbi:MAG TPA: patatin-like phospholipase family protein [Vicinamibacterales bacterium]|nr:patatin-like phospholipase family protein [Vicinamibacterales bacterium]
MPRRSLILAGGGLKVAFQAGVLQVWLDEAGQSFDHIDAASGGVFNLAMLCQGHNGRQIADKWRETRLLDGISPNLPRFDGLPAAAALFDLDGYRQRVFPKWGLHWPTITQSTLEATFNVYNFSKHELEVRLPGAMSEDALCACVSLPMWFPPVEMNGDTYIDSVFITDANLEEAIRRGADEIWVIWTVSRRAEWHDGFVANYFQIIETAANGHFNRICRRIEQNNTQIATGGPGEFGRPIVLKILAAEVPLHYLINVNDDRLHEAVNLGVTEARGWCQAEGIAFTPGPPPGPPPESSGPTSLRFTEQMVGFIALGEADYTIGHDRGRLAGLSATVRLTIGIDDVDRFVTDVRNEAKAEGAVTCSAFGGRRPVSDGVFNLLVDSADPNTKAMYYRLFFTNAEGAPLTLVGFKHIHDDPGPDEWEDTTTLFTRVLKGHVPLAEEAGAPIEAAGIIRIQLFDFFQQMTTFRVDGPTVGARVSALARFGTLFMGRLWEVYGPRGI